MHHTWRPNHSQFNGFSTIESMWEYHTETKGWSDIAQHISIAPDGSIWTGRSWDQAPASARGFNGNATVGPFMQHDSSQEAELDSTTVAPPETTRVARGDTLPLELIRGLRPHVINLNLGRFSTTGQFQTRPADLGHDFRGASARMGPWSRWAKAADRLLRARRLDLGASWAADGRAGAGTVSIASNAGGAGPGAWRSDLARILEICGSSHPRLSMAEQQPIPDLRLRKQPRCEFGRTRSKTRTHITIGRRVSCA
jgi:hypothetical protein